MIYPCERMYSAWPAADSPFVVRNNRKVEVEKKNKKNFSRGKKNENENENKKDDGALVHICCGGRVSETAMAIPGRQSTRTRGRDNSGLFNCGAFANPTAYKA